MLVAEYPDFQVGAELENCRNIQAWATTYVSEFGALRNRLRLKRKDATNRGQRPVTAALPVQAVSGGLRSAEELFPALPERGTPEWDAYVRGQEGRVTA